MEKSTKEIMPNGRWSRLRSTQPPTLTLLKQPFQTCARLVLAPAFIESKTKTTCDGLPRDTPRLRTPVILSLLPRHHAPRNPVRHGTFETCQLEIPVSSPSRYRFLVLRMRGQVGGPEQSRAPPSGERGPPRQCDIWNKTRWGVAAGSGFTVLWPPPRERRLTRTREERSRGLSALTRVGGRRRHYGVRGCRIHSLHQTTPAIIAPLV